ncbi:hypothetical protein DICPUDRAFT_81808 [Dictyostelium purpureum]|uniref:Uncharacterized protein n=1 Tax=Dictyostelium purpureum TaxID=5786 RepID=F0ZUN0_DICPU|nr:uncharacterized protein DICPUDRAFT_81808 [Dictyostelium purpureum]EGC32361.1 hypothetical protein DICPUDRAFT_81808 [Dictyostelium purpureum]|eukprot:XP_003291126.1 hypothetical protein DICPUDRAFT_81808 [Dictyostelium purpureum]
MGFYGCKINKKIKFGCKIKSCSILWKIGIYSIINNNNNYTTTVTLAFSLKNSNSNYNLNSSISEYSNLNNNSTSLARSASCSCNSNDSKSNNNTTTAAPDPTTVSLQNSYSKYNLNSIGEYSNLNNNSISLARSASCSSNDSNESSRNLIKEELKSPPNYILLHLKTLNIGNIQETLDKFHSNIADHPKITYEAKKKYLEYSNIEDIEKLFRAISTYSAVICRYRENFKNNSTKSNFSSNVSPVYNYTST